MGKLFLNFLFLIFISNCATGLLFAQDLPYDVKANYTKTVYSIQMRDGVKLFTVVYSPKDESKKYPILFQR
jgi:predicted acyl esterase